LGIAWIFGSFSLVSLVVPTANETYQDLLLHSVMLRFFIALVVMTCSALIVWIRRQSESEARSQSRFNEIQQLYRETELNALRQQLQPHFLFNSLNSIQSLAATDPQKARNMVLQLSDFLRGTLRKDNHTQLTVEEEIDHTRLYLEIEMVRFSDRLQVDWEVDENVKTLMIPALVLQPLVENAIKFGVYQTSGPVQLWIDVKAENNHVILTVKNPFDPAYSGSAKGTGFGLNSLQRRLYLLYGRNDLVQTTTKEHYFTATLKIPISN
jgi:LytS/YehU family sensor histidine kinase